MIRFAQPLSGFWLYQDTKASNHNQRSKLITIYKLIWFFFDKLCPQKSDNTRSRLEFVKTKSFTNKSCQAFYGKVEIVLASSSYEGISYFFPSNFEEKITLLNAKLNLLSNRGDRSDRGDRSQNAVTAVTAEESATHLSGLK